jgi:predicted TIM-barrel fold metal-dependent hydrolase
MLGRVIDSHVHVWGDGKAFEFNMAPPIDLQGDKGSPETLLQLMDAAGVQGALIIQPINYQYDHSYLLDILREPRYQQRFKLMALMDPTLEEASYGECLLDGLKRQGFVGIRYNPYLFPPGEQMSGAKGVAWFRKAGELNLCIGIMCFKGLSLHYDDIVQLLTTGNGDRTEGEKTKVIIDHWGFFVQGGQVDEEAWKQLLSLAAFPEVYVKISALWRVSVEPFPHLDLDHRLLQLVEAFGTNRLLFGTDFPYVQQQQVQQQDKDAAPAIKESYVRYVAEAMQSWPQCRARLTATQWDELFCLTAESLFGAFP